MVTGGGGYNENFTFKVKANFGCTPLTTGGGRLNFEEILSPSQTKNQRFYHFWGQYQVYEYIIWDLTYENFLYFKTKRFLMISQIFSKIISFLCFYSSSIIISLLYLSKTQKWDYFWKYLRYHQKSFCFGI